MCETQLSKMEALMVDQMSSVPHLSQFHTYRYILSKNNKTLLSKVIKGTFQKDPHSQSSCCKCLTQFLKIICNI